MIVSASRRTDIPAFYSDWFMNRIRAGFCQVPNPFNPRQCSRVSLKWEDVDCIVFWTRNPTPLLHHLSELDARGFHYYFHVTVMDHPRDWSPGTLPVEESIAAFQVLSGQIGPERMIWRYDPVVFSRETPASFHQEKFALIADKLAGFCKRAVVSFMDLYPTVSSRLRRLGMDGLRGDAEGMADLIRFWNQKALACGMALFSCAEEVRFVDFGLCPGKCIDDELIYRLFGHQASKRKDPNQRPACGCVLARDIGSYDTCPCGCVYCYATRSLHAAEQNYRRHDPQGASLTCLEKMPCLMGRAGISRPKKPCI